MHTYVKVIILVLLFGCYFSDICSFQCYISVG